MRAWLVVLLTYGDVTEHSLDSRGGNDQLDGGIRLELVSEVDEHTELVLAGVVGNRSHLRLRDLLVVYFDVADRGLHGA